MAKANSLKPKPSLLYIMARINGKHVLWVDKEATRSFMSPKLTRELGACQRVEQANSSRCSLQR